MLTLFFSGDKTPSGFPIITQSPQTRVIEIGHTAVMQCRSTGNPTPKIYWLKDGKRLEMNQRYTLIDGKRFYYDAFHSFVFHELLNLLINNMVLLTPIYFIRFVFFLLLAWLAF